MNYISLIIIAIAGVAVGMYMARRRGSDGFIAKPLVCAEFKLFLRS
ncbi:MAG: hypothetical protein NUV98_07120 [Candidatus Roizmanbacteria bacterium]|nr:hypothetical protein [Candidatus Roizmanbacteria bacterium]